MLFGPISSFIKEYFRRIIILAISFLLPITSFAFEHVVKTHEEHDDSIEKTITFRRGMIGDNIIEFYTLLHDLNLLSYKHIQLEDNDKYLFESVIRNKILPLGYPKSANKLFCKLNPHIRCKRNIDGTTKMGIYHTYTRFKVPAFEFDTNRRLMQIQLNDSDNLRDDHELLKILVENKILDQKSLDEEKNGVLSAVKELNGNFDRDFYTGNDPTKLSRVITVPVISAVTKLSLSSRNWDSLTKELNERLSDTLDNILIEDRATPPIEKKQQAILRNDKETFVSHWERIYTQLGARKGWKEEWIKELPDNLPKKSYTIIVDSFQDDPLKCDKGWHGNHVSGIINANPENGVFEGITYPWVDLIKFDIPSENSIVSNKACSDSKYNCNVVQLLEHHRSAHVVNLSLHWQSNKESDFGKNLLKTINITYGKVYIVASGNENVEIKRNSKINVPFAFAQEDNVITVTSLDQTGASIFGNKNDPDSTVTSDMIIDIAAPGVDIPSTCLGNAIDMMSGASQATAFVSSVASLLAFEGMNLGSDIKLRILYTADIDSDLNRQARYGVLNLQNALYHYANKICEKKSDCAFVDEISFGYKKNDENQFHPSKTLLVRKSSGRDIKLNGSAVRRIVCKTPTSHSELECSIAYLSIKDEVNNDPRMGVKLKLIHNVTGIIDDATNKQVAIWVTKDNRKTDYNFGDFEDVIFEVGSPIVDAAP